MAMRLPDDLPAMSRLAANRVELARRGACWCGNETAKLVCRRVGRADTVYIQCDRCGNAIGPAIKREGIAYLALPPWDDALVARWHAESLAALEARRERVEREREQAYIAQRRAYAHWCRTSPDWHAARAAVLRRSGRCEACLSAAATCVHHLTYAFGKLPPAWELRAVCTACHERLHADAFGEADEWCPRSLVNQV